MAGTIYTSPSQPAAYKSNSGGLNSTGSPLSLKDNESSDLQNVEFTRFGSILKRSGYTALNTSAIATSPQLTSLHFLELSSGTDYLTATAGSKFYKMDSLDGTWDDVTGAVTITPGALFKWDTFLDTAVGTNDTDVPIQWTGTGNASAMAVPASLTTAKWIKLYFGYLFLGNVTVGGNRLGSAVYWSGLNDITTVGSPNGWSSSNSAFISKNDGQDITGLETLGDKLIIFKDRSIWVGYYTGDADIPFGFYQSQSNVGAVSGYSIQAVKNGLVFLSFDGIYYFDGNNSTKISDRINVTVQGLSVTKRANATSVFYKTKQHYILSCASAGSNTNDTMIVWDAYNDAWLVWKGMAASALEIVFASQADERWYFGDYSGFAYRADTGTNDSPLNVTTAINAYYYTKWFDYDELVSVKQTPHIYIYLQKGLTAIITFAYSYDFISGDSYSQTFTVAASGANYDDGVSGYDIAGSVYGGTGGTYVRRDLTSRGRVVRFKFANANQSQTFQIDGFGVPPSLETRV